MIHNGDCLTILKEIGDNSIDSLITDPPAGISFMGKEWDEDKGGSKQWIAWMSSVMVEVKRVLKPGAHGLVWAIPRTSHWTATALEDAGFEIRDVITHLFGSGFPKSMNISIAIDKSKGAMGARGKAFVTAGAGERKDIQDTTGWEKDPGHEGITPEAKQWQGFGTALKPASEHWILVRKPLSEKTVAANTLKYGTGGINIDASRIQTTDKISGSGNISKHKKNTMSGGGVTREETGILTKAEMGFGRFPANLVLSHNEDCEDKCTPGCAVAMLDEQSGTLHSGGASRFFFNIKPDKMDNVWQDQRLLNYADTVDESLRADAQQAFIVLGLVLKKARLEDKQLKSTVTRFMTETQKLLESSDETIIETIQSIARKSLQELTPINMSCSGLATNAESLKLIDTTKTILSLLTLDFYVESAISNIMQKSVEVGERDLNGNRFMYCAKASKADKNAGCEGLPEKDKLVYSGGITSADHPESASGGGNRPAANHHPTVKSTKLMSYLIKLITPPNGIVLDPFMGSGSTGVSAVKEGFQFVYIQIAEKRIYHALPEFKKEYDLK